MFFKLQDDLSGILIGWGRCYRYWNPEIESLILKLGIFRIIFLVQPQQELRKHFLSPLLAVEDFNDNQGNHDMATIY